MAWAIGVIAALGATGAALWVRRVVRATARADAQLRETCERLDYVEHRLASLQRETARIAQGKAEK